MLTISIETSPTLAHWQHDMLANEGKLNVAAVRALNKTARWVRTRVSSRTAHSLKIKTGLVRSDMFVVRAGVSRPVVKVALKSTAGVIPAKELGTVSQNAQGVGVGKRQFDRAFIASMPNGHRGVFRRRSSSRLPIQPVQIVITGKMHEIMETLSEGPLMEQFERIFAREIRYVMRSK